MMKLFAVLLLVGTVEAFVPSSKGWFLPHKLHAGGFEWEDPQQAFDQNVENPFKNPKLLDGSDGMKVDPGRLLSPRLSGSNLYLIGMMGSGKTAVGDIVARRMGTYNFLDTDQILEKAVGKTIPKIFEEDGEDQFREVESQVLDSVHAYVRCVISTGGGIVERRENWSKLQSGIVVWLDVDPEVIIKRLEGSGVENRPLLKTENPLQTLQDLLERRKLMYSQADIAVCVDSDTMGTEEVADMVIRQMHDFIDDNPPAWKVAKVKAQSEGLDWVQ